MGQTGGQSSSQSTTGLGDTAVGSNGNSGRSSGDKGGGSVHNSGSYNRGIVEEGSGNGVVGGNNGVGNLSRVLNNGLDNGGVGYSVGGSENWGRDSKGECCLGSKREGSGGSKGGEGGSVEEELGISLGFTLVQSVHSLIAVARQRAGVARGGVGAVEIGGVGGVKVRGIGFRPSGAKGSKGENSGLK